MATTVVFRLIHGTVRTGIWCNACMTSGGFEVPLYRLCDEHAAHLVTIGFGCLTCQGPGDLER